MDRTVNIARTVTVLWDAGVAALRDTAATILLDDADAGTVELTVDVGSTHMTRSAAATIGAPLPVDRHRLSIPIEWHAEEHTRRFPTVKGTVELQSLSTHPPLSELSLHVAHEAPLGLLGTIGDAVGGMELARGASEALLDRMAARLTVQVAENAAAAAELTSVTSRGAAMMRIDSE